MTQPTPISIKNYKSIVVLTGAGISAASGLRTYRGPGGLWNEPDVAKLSSLEHFSSVPEEYWRFWGSLREHAGKAEPSRAHIALCDWQKQLAGDQKFTLITQNVDRLHQRAGSSNVVELHGSVFRTRCSNSQCKLTPYEDTNAHADELPLCPQCKSPLRPDIVLFGEMLPPDAEWATKRALRDCDLFIAVGTSGTVAPASRFVEWAKYAEAATILVNLEAMSPKNPAFEREYIGPADDILPALLK